ncbi:MAG: EamA family transporter [Planctomycetota bacterium]|nr:EamA family transporter [Planctomycetota bacterium]MDA1140623.1 EamA family transporter [Planctomycetota bacterium]
MNLFLFAVCFFGWGFAIFIMTIVGKALDQKTIIVCNLIGYLIANIYFVPRAKLAWTMNHGLATLVGILFVLSNLAYYKLCESGAQASVLAPLSGLYVIVPVILGILFLNEEPTIQKMGGVVLAIGAIYLLSSSPGAA